MKTKDVRKKSEEELKKQLAELQEELRTIRFGMAGSVKQNVRKPSHLKSDIARIKTILAEKQ
ncbi:50S ribosomal protein L29 [Candidatus Kaiserbacteria bacterium CG10_big_fil_rev_8_21_14_0_10_45_20]|uniref:Large ribosomal subunit protein uL29 n=1 Tax=Candidatus Kaiserbacteria bacterium CG10_big_fil_rev_8_21_14_0_10_45_20 TaxID=1974607 RepID=A0A2H0UHL5_9BACT|nr:MAG: 50S ribosomal protein L29 [Candidatus Kaiserbacteria bacterium CG10_big_fil_rev_8_21_14_0_10_45_20]